MYQNLEQDEMLPLPLPLLIHIIPLTMLLELFQVVLDKLMYKTHKPHNQLHNLLSQLLKLLLVLVLDVLLGTLSLLLGTLSLLPDLYM